MTLNILAVGIFVIMALLCGGGYWCRRQRLKQGRESALSRLKLILQNISRQSFLLDKEGRVLYAHLDTSPWQGRCIHVNALMGKCFIKVLEESNVSLHERAQVRAALRKLPEEKFKNLSCTFANFSFKLRLISLKGLSSYLAEVRSLVILESSHERTCMNDDANFKTFSLFLNNIGHELRTPLNTILGFCELAQRELKNKANPDREKCLNYINYTVHNSNELCRILLQLIDLARLSIHDTVLNDEVVDLRLVLEETQCQILDSVCNDLSLQTPQSDGSLHSNISFLCDMDRMPPLRARVDLAKMVRAFKCLICETIRMVQPKKPISMGLKRMDTGDVCLYFVCQGEKNFPAVFLDTIQAPLLMRDTKTSRSRYALDFIMACALANLHDGYIELEIDEKSESKQGKPVKMLFVLPEKRVINSGE